MSTSPTLPTISDEDFLKFRDFFYRKTGIYFEETKRYFVDKRLVERIQATNNQNFRSYFTMLRFETAGKELQALTNLMTVNETYFFREDYQFACLVNSILEEIVQYKPKGEPIRIWSVPSSSGEEPYSIAIYLLEYWRRVNDYDIEIIASDIDTEILEKARQGRYDKRSIARLPTTVLYKHFKPLLNDQYQLSDDLRQSVDFTLANITDLNQMRSYRDFDVIFCRNLLIYFDDTSRRVAAESFFSALRPGGFICLGHSESMSRITGLFKIRKFPEAIVYQKPR